MTETRFRSVSPSDTVEPACRNDSRSERQPELRDTHPLQNPITIRIPLHGASQGPRKPYFESWPGTVLSVPYLALREQACCPSKYEPNQLKDCLFNSPHINAFCLSYRRVQFQLIITGLSVSLGNPRRIRNEPSASTSNLACAPYWIKPSEILRGKHSNTVFHAEHPQGLWYIVCDGSRGFPDK